jgi:3-carboxy-cis,cis-muconate cycloisomerase
VHPIGFRSEQYASLFSSEEVGRVFGYEGQIGAWLEFEAALARAQARLGIVPAEAAEEITRQATISNVPVKDYQGLFATTMHPVMPMVRLLTRACSGDLGQYVHWGATTQDVMDTGLVLQIRVVHDVFDGLLSALLTSLMEKAEAHKATAMAGRTHAQHAVPITLGYKLAVYADEVARHLRRAREAAADLEVVQFGGAAGTLASLPTTGLAVRRELAVELGLREPEITWHTSRDRVAAYAFAVASTCMTLQRLAHEIMTLQRPEIAELEEPFHEGKVGSSTMPHKRNPVLAEVTWALARTAAESLSPIMAAMTQEHERDMSFWALEWDAVPRMLDAAVSALKIATPLVEGLRCLDDRMGQNLDLTEGLILSEALMMGLAETRGRQRAHDLVYDASMRSAEGGGTLMDLLLPDLDGDERQRLAGMFTYESATAAAEAMTTEALRRISENARRSNRPIGHLEGSR